MHSLLKQCVPHFTEIVTCLSQTMILPFPQQKYSLNKVLLGKVDRITYPCEPMHGEINDEQLMLQYQQGDAQAFEVLYSRYRQSLHRYLQHQCQNAAIAEELFQDIWMNIIRARDRYQPTALFRTYLYRLAHNRLIDHYRKQKHGIPRSYDDDETLLNQTHTSNPISPERMVDAQQQLERFEQVLTQLPEAQREAFLLKENAGLSVEEIAAITDVKPETAKSRIRYAVKRFKQQLDLTDHD